MRSLRDFVSERKRPRSCSRNARRMLRVAGWGIARLDTTSTLFAQLAAGPSLQTGTALESGSSGDLTVAVWTWATVVSNPVYAESSRLTLHAAPRALVLPGRAPSCDEAGGAAEGEQQRAHDPALPQNAVIKRTQDLTGTLPSVRSREAVDEARQHHKTTAMKQGSARACQTSLLQPPQLQDVSTTAGGSCSHDGCAADLP